MQHRRITRLYLDRDLGEDRVRLTERETNYLGNVLRLKRGDRVLAFNGAGQERYATIALLARQGAELELLEPAEPLPESELELTLIQALPKADAMDLIVQKITELGVRALWPVTSDHSVVKLDAERAERRAAHWLRIALSACEQSGRHRPPELRPVAPLESCLADVPPGSVRIALDLRSEGALELPPRPVEAPVFLLVGPEGGFSEGDLAQIKAHGFARMRLGPRTLRAETAAIVATGLLQSLLGDLR